MPHLIIRHLTEYSYRQPVALGEHRTMMRPRESFDQRLVSARLAITPQPAELHWLHDVFGNSVAIARDPCQAVPLSGLWTGYPGSNLGMSVEVEIQLSDAAPAPHGATNTRFG